MVCKHPVVSDLIEKGFYEDALFYCERLFEIEKNQDYLYTIGWILMSQKKYFQAISAFERYTGKESSYMKAKCYYELKQFTEAEELLELIPVSTPLRTPLQPPP